MVWLVIMMSKFNNYEGKIGDYNMFNDRRLD